MDIKDNIFYWMDRLEITCNNNNCEHFNMIYTSQLKENKQFTCDECESIILMCDSTLIEQTK